MTSNLALTERREASVPRGVASAHPIFIKRAQNAEVWDVEGKRYIDFAGGIGVLNVGHRHPRVLMAVHQQLDNYIHTAFQVAAYEPYVALCERLNAVAPFSGPAKSVLFNSGAESVENAVKIARAATRRQGVIAFSGAFHGRTALTMTLTGKVNPYKQNFGISPPGIFHIPFPADDPASIEQTLEALTQVFRCDLAPSDVAAIVIEPVQGEGGFHAAPRQLLQALRALCDSNGIVFIADEVQSGFARTGKMFGIEASGVEPDLVTIAKSLAAGFPLSGVIGRAKLMDAVEPGGLGGTFAGNPVACAAALAVLDIIQEERLLDRAQHLGDRAVRKLQEVVLDSRRERVTSVRCRGAMIAFDIVDRNGAPDAAAAKRITNVALANGLLLLTCGIHGNTIRLLFPLTIQEEVFSEGLGLLERAILAVPCDE